MMFVPHWNHTCGPARPVTRIALLLYMQMMFVPHRKHTYFLSQPVNGDSFTSLHVYDVRTSQKDPYKTPRPVVGIVLLPYM
jgi:hypothetical protein